jgi:DNA-binding transcriptional ArsR family regulator
MATYGVPAINPHQYNILIKGIKSFSFNFPNEKNYHTYNTTSFKYKKPGPKDGWNGLTLKILNYIAKKNGASVRELTQAFSLNRKTIYYHLNKLIKLELIERYPNVKKHNPHVLYIIRHCRLKSNLGLNLNLILNSKLNLKSNLKSNLSLSLNSNLKLNLNSISNLMLFVSSNSKTNGFSETSVKSTEVYSTEKSAEIFRVDDLSKSTKIEILTKLKSMSNKTELSTITGISRLKSSASVLNMSLALNIYPTNARRLAKPIIKPIIKPTIFNPIFKAPKEFNAKKEFKPMTQIVKSTLHTKSIIISDTNRIFFDFQYIQDLKPSIKNNFEVINGVKSNQNGVKPQKSDQSLSLKIKQKRREQNKKAVNNHKMNNHKCLKTFKSLIPLKILLELAEKPQTVSELAKKLNISKRTVRYHISNLQKITNYHIIRCGGTRCKYAYLMLSPVKIEHRHKFTKYHRRYHRAKRIRALNLKTNKYKTFSLKTIRKLFSSASYEIVKKPVKCSLYTSGPCGNTSLFKINLPDHHTYLCHEHFKLLRNESLTL